jgi:hypothetical protein
MIVQYLAAGACMLAVASLPVSKTTVGAALRRWAAFLFVLAFIPSMCFGLVQHTARSQMPWTSERLAEEVLTVLVVSAIAFGVLAIRKAMKAGDRKAPKHVNAKQPVTPPGAGPDLFNLLREQLRGDDDDAE